MVKLSWRFFHYFDWVSFFLTLLLSAIGLLFIWSATYAPEQMYSPFFKKQALGIGIGIIIYFLCSLHDYHILLRWGYIGYIGILGLLFFTLIKGSIGMGGQRWLNLGFIKMQPSELTKLFFPAFAGYYMHVHKDRIIFTISDIAPIFLILGLSFFLILKQPDLGTALIIFFSGCIIFWLTGISRRFLIICLVMSISAAPFFWHVVLKPYQKKRIAVFLGQGNTKKERYNIEQAAIAIGSGGLFGKGLLRGTQNKLKFLPASRTDFIFAVICEEWGFIGALIILFLYGCLCIRIFSTIMNIKIPDIQLLAAGISMHIILSILINIGMVLNLLPVTGIPLPFMSYGLSNLLVIFATLGWLQSIRIQSLSEH